MFSIFHNYVSIENHNQVLKGLSDNWKQASNFLIYMQIMTTTGKMFQVQLFSYSEIYFVIKKILVSGIVTKDLSARKSNRHVRQYSKYSRINVLLSLCFQIWSIYNAMLVQRSGLVALGESVI